jgi:FtsH-binding integral membrane protein
MDTPENAQAAMILTHNNDVLSGSFAWMAGGLLISAITSIIVAITPAFVNFILGSTLGFIIIVVIQLGIVIFLTRKINSFGTGTARLLFILYAILTGTTLSVIFFAFNLSSIISILLACTVMFTLLAIYGSHTKKDLTKIGQLAFFALIGLIVASVISLFITSNILDLVLSAVGVVIFTALIMYDAQKIKNISLQAYTPEEISKAKIIGALTLYLDFINLFLNLLRLFGRKK